MRRMLNRLLPDAQDPPGTGPLADPTAERAAALQARATADARLRQAEARLRGAKAVRPDPASGENWAMRPKAWTDAAPKPWCVSPASGTEVTPGLTLFHDCPRSELSLRQSLGRAEDPAPFGVSLDILRFDGAFVSLCCPLPPEDAKTLSPQDVVQVELTVSMAHPLPFYVRLNLSQPPNQRDMLASLPLGDRLSGPAQVAFDLAYARLDRAPIADAWLDVILEKPALNRVRFADMRVSRRTRAEL